MLVHAQKVHNKIIVYEKHIFHCPIQGPNLNIMDINWEMKCVGDLQMASTYVDSDKLDGAGKIWWVTTYEF